MLVEIILGKETGEAALAVALDYVRAIRKTPIVVNDSRGFYTSRVVGTYIREGHLMLTEGVPAAMIENVGAHGRHAGRAAVAQRRSRGRSRLEDLEGDRSRSRRRQAIDQRQKALLDEMVEKRGRFGRKNGKGFYDYPQSGPKRLWPGLADLQPNKLDPDTIDIDELKHRFLAMQALESARCIEEGVVTDVREADVGSILGFGFAPFTGGTISYIDGMGTKAFVELCSELGADVRRPLQAVASFSSTWRRRARRSTAASRRKSARRSREPSWAPFDSLAALRLRSRACIRSRPISSGTLHGA